MRTQPHPPTPRIPTALSLLAWSVLHGDGGEAAARALAQGTLRAAEGEMPPYDDERPSAEAIKKGVLQP